MTTNTTRRKILQSIGGGISIAFAGCIGGDDDSSGDSNTNQNTDAQNETPQSTETVDQQSASGSEGLLYAFAPERAVVADPAAGRIDTDLQTGMSEQLTGASWGDVRATDDEKKLFAVEDSGNRVGVFDTEQREFREWVSVGGGPTHAYNPVDGEIWVHADDEGRLYVIDTDSHEVIERVQTGLEVAGHGKLLHHDDLGRTAYATNTNDAAVHVVDLENYERTETINLGDSGGTHYAYYGPQNERLYVEYFGGNMPIVDTTTNEVVDRVEHTGSLKMSPDGEYLGVLQENGIQFLDATSETSDHLGTVELDNRGPDDLDYFRADGTLYAFAANTLSEEASLINVDEQSVVTHVQAGSISQDGEHIHRSGTIGGGYYFTPSDAEGTVPVIDVEQRELLHEIDVGDGVNTVSYIGNGNGAWY
ncbi:hypothetical protein SAMN05216226_12211 [Halovenus aranensis]|uniref:40-residue YVTN family beta-propeller repeat-containing protein n=1 Tax=Halovenus aranensis TaxID=890420 RepID=A0A1G8ZEF6_9EURY|nr:YncE family protein [Halovenus aranensis]SDK13441.1 hypothetical protein SAMN05216226_12211 [Halovenus aranensis]